MTQAHHSKGPAEGIRQGRGTQEWLFGAAEHLAYCLLCVFYLHILSFSGTSPASLWTVQLRVGLVR